MTKATLLIPSRDPMSFGKTIINVPTEGYLYTQKDGKRLFVHHGLTYKDNWTVSEPRTGYNVTQHDTSYKTRKEAMKGAEQYIKKSMALTSMAWEDICRKPKQVNTLPF